MQQFNVPNISPQRARPAMSAADNNDQRVLGAIPKNMYINCEKKKACQDTTKHASHILSSVYIPTSKEKTFKKYISKKMLDETSKITEKEHYVKFNQPAAKLQERTLKKSIHVPSSLSAYIQESRDDEELETDKNNQLDSM
ncbi:uncharacterized protein [Anoplolepis gracilipes]|uniref:uncharacterized protein isoform X2 n=1 Tax=Anoplolepis gracilipes TaxID=354296 RepID=UPI003BA0D150